MADKKISQLTAATLPLAGTEVLPLVQTSTKKVAVADLLGGVTVSSGFSASITGGGTVYLGAANSYGDLALLKNAAGVTKIGVSNNDGTASSGATFSSYYGNTEIGAFGHYWNGGEFINRIKYFSKQEFAEGTTVRVRIEQTSGDLTAVTGNFVVGTAGKGIDFSANTHATGMTKEVLDWYEEGAFTPVWNGGSITVGLSKYTRIGRNVVWIFDLTFGASAVVATSTLTLPFPCVDDWGAGSINYTDAGATLFVNLEGSTDTLQFRSAANAASESVATLATKRVVGMVIYNA